MHCKRHRIFHLCLLTTELFICPVYIIPTFENSADAWTVADYNPDVLGTYKATASLTIPEGFIWADGVSGEVEVSVSVRDKADKTALNAAIALAETKNEEEYTKESWRVMQEKLKAAQEISAKDGVWQEEVDAATKALQKAIDELVKKSGTSDYTVTFDTNGGSAVDSQTVAGGNKAQKPADPQKLGYQFAGWFAQDAQEAFDFEHTAISADITLTAHWEKVSQNVSDESYEELGSIVAEAEGLDSKAYSAESWAKLQKALKAAYTAAANPNATDEEVKAAAEEVRKALAALNKAEGQTGSIALAKITVADTVYDGKAQQPKVTVTYNNKTLALNKDYKIAYSNNHAVGQGKVTVTGIGSYTGVKEASFQIGLQTPGTAKLSGKKGGKLLVKLKKTPGATGYEVSYAKNKKFKGAKKKTTKKLKITLKKLKKGKNYYVRVRTYTKVGTKTVYSNYSKAVKKKVKK